MNTSRMQRWSWCSGMALAASAGLALVVSAMPAAGAARAEGSVLVESQNAPDKIILRGGRVVTGTIVEETDSTISIKVLAGGIQSSVATVFNKSDVLTIERGAPAADPAPAGNATPARPTPGQSSSESTVDPNATRVYHLRLTGEFAKDISQTPIRAAIEDAARNEAQVIIVELDNEWRADQFSEKAEDEHAFDEFWRAADIVPIFTNDLANLYAGKTKPRVVFWVKNAMGGAAFLPLMSRDIYFAPSGRMGGVGDLDTYFSGIDEWVKDKQQSLRLAAARGVALLGGYETELIDAMVLREKVFSVGFSTGRPLLYEGPPQPGDTLLTDDGAGENEDSDADVVRALGNDNLTLHADIAQKLEVSDGTVRTLDELLDRLDLTRSHVMVSQRADRIMDDWATGIDEGIRSFQRIADQELPEARGAEGGGDWQQRNAARGRQKVLIEQMLRLLNKYKEVLDPGGQLMAQLQLELEAIRLRTIADPRR